MLRYQRADAAQRADGEIDVLLRRYEHHLDRAEAAIPSVSKSILGNIAGELRRFVFGLEWMQHNPLPTSIILVVLMVLLFAVVPGSDRLVERAVQLLPLPR